MSDHVQPAMHRSAMARDEPDTQGPPDFVVLNPDGTAVYGCGDIEDMMDALSVDKLALDVGGAGWVQVWHIESESSRNTLAEQVLSRLGYSRPADFACPIALTTRAAPMVGAESLSVRVCEVVDEFVSAAGDVKARPASCAVEMIDAVLPPGPHTTVPSEPHVAAAPSNPPPAPAPAPGREAGL